MKASWAEENLRTIRHLMESASLYRRALAPISIWIGLLGLAGSAVGWLGFSNLHSAGFALFWMCLALVAIGGGFYIVRRQAMRDGEPLFSPPSKKIIQAMSPALTAGIGGMLVLFSDSGGSVELLFWVILSWITLYGCAVHAAGFFMKRGIKWFGWVFILSSLFLSVLLYSSIPKNWSIRDCHLLMGLSFGGLHLVYGIYLLITEAHHAS